MEPLNPCGPRTRSTFKRGPNAPQDEYLQPKGAAAKPSPSFGLTISLPSALRHPLKVGPVPKPHKVSGGPLGVPQKRKHILEYGEV